MKNKTAKYAGFKSAPNTFDPDRPPGDWSAVFGNKHPLVAELGCGRAEFSLELARRYPRRNFVGIDIKADRMWRPSQTAQAEGLSNIAFLRTDLRILAESFTDGSVEELWITFPDPYPKNRQAKHRMINLPFLEQYRRVLKPNGLVHLKTDDLPLFQYTLEVLVTSNSASLKVLNFDLHNSDLADDIKIMTTYEKRFVAEGKKINYVCFSLA